MNDVPAFTLTDDELQTALDAAAFYRDAKLQERTALHLPMVVIREGEPIPGPDTLDGQIIRAGQLVSTLTMEAMRRDLAERDAAREKSGKE